MVDNVSRSASRVVRAADNINLCMSQKTSFINIAISLQGSNIRSVLKVSFEVSYTQG